MQKYKLQLNEDINVSYELTAKGYDEAQEKALDMLGWSLLKEDEPENENQTIFNF